MEILARDKHSSLLHTLKNYRHIKSHKIGPLSQSFKEILEYIYLLYFKLSHFSSVGKIVHNYETVLVTKM